MNFDVVIVKIMQDIVAGVTPSCNYQPGRDVQILDTLLGLDNSITLKGTKYPLIAMVLPVPEKRGTGYYAKITIPRIVFAQIVSNENSEVLPRYDAGGSFESILYPCYYSFLKQCGASPWIVGQDPDFFPHTKVDNPGIQPIGEGLSDYVDCIDIFDLELTINQIKNCK